MTVWVMVDNGFIESYDAFKTIILMTRVTCQMLQWGYKFSHRHIWIWMCTLPITLWNLQRNNAKYNVFPTRWWYLLAGLLPCTYHLCVIFLLVFIKKCCIYNIVWKYKKYKYLQILAIFISNQHLGMTFRFFQFCAKKSSFCWWVADYCQIFLKYLNYYDKIYCNYS